MRPPLINQIIVVALAVTAFFACTMRPEPRFELDGIIEGLTEGKIILSAHGDRETAPDTAIIENGAFFFSADIPEPAPYNLEIVNQPVRIRFYAENAQMTLRGHIDSIGMRHGGVYISGGRTQDDYNAFQAREEALAESFRLPEMRQELQVSGRSSPEARQRFLDVMEQYNTARRRLIPEFIADHPDSYFSAFLIQRDAHGKSAVEIEDELFLLDPSLFDFHVVETLLEQVQYMKEAEIGIDKIITEAENLLYKVNPAYSGKTHQGVVYLGINAQDQVCALQNNGTVRIIDPSGKTVRNVQTDLKSRPEGIPSAIAVDGAGLLYVMATLFRTETVSARGRTREISVPSGVQCLVYTPHGQFVRELQLEANVTASGARVMDDKLLVADHRNRIIGVYDTESGEHLSSISNLRACCSILDFDINEKDEVLVANIGAFRVQGFDLDGNTIVSFGQRGNGLDEFHGCCNPVSVAYLSSGGIVTVEKDPTRIKVYSKDGARAIEGIMELVEGCSYIPMIVDSKDNVYLASTNHGIIKCSPSDAEPPVASAR